VSQEPEQAVRHRHRAASSSGATARAALAVREFRGLIIAQIASDAGDQIARVALALLVLERTGSAFGAAATFALSFVPVFFGAAFLGPLADRVSRRSLMLGADLGRALLIGLLALVATPGAPLPLLFGLLLISEFLTPVFDAARTASVPSMLREPALVSAGLGLSRTLALVNQVVGLVIGGLVVTLVSPRAALLVDAVTFLVSFGVLAMTLQRRVAALPGPTTPAALLVDLREGARVLYADRSRRALILLAWCMGATIVAPETLGLPYARWVGAQDYWGGILMAAPIAGVAAGSFVVSRRPLGSQLQWILPLAVVSGLPLLVTGLEPPLPLLTVVWFIGGALQAYVISIIAITTLLTDDGFRGRVTGMASAGFALGSLVGTLMAGWFADLSSPAFAVTLIACLGIAIAGGASVVWPRAELQSDVAALGAQ
jgi:MFS family permease